MIRFLDFFLSLLGLLILSPILLSLIVAGYIESGSPFFYQQRVGRFARPFRLLKFRTMPVATPSVATHLVDTSAISPFGRILRKSKLDELPQLWNVLCGDMSLVGPRPCLFNQDELIAERLAKGIFDVRPGITGLAQINGIDMSRPKLLAEVDEKMIRSLSVRSYFFYIFATIIGCRQQDCA